MLPLTRLVGIAACLSLIARHPLVGQIDYRNLDAGRPTRVEDAYPVERHAFEFAFPYALEREAGGEWTHVVPLELEYGVALNSQIGLGLPLARVAGTQWGLAGVHLFGLYNFNSESPVLPAVSLRLDASLPAGSLGGDDVRGGVAAIVTRSFGRARVHLNGALGFGPQGAPAAVEPLGRWWIGAAADYTLFRQSVLLLVEAHVDQMTRAAPAERIGSLGLRWQWRPTVVLDLGVARRLPGGAGPDFAVTVGINRAFALAALMGRGRP